MELTEEERKERKLASQRKYYAKMRLDPDFMSKRKKSGIKYEKNNREKVLARKKRYRDNNTEKRAIYRKEYRNKNLVAEKLWGTEYYQQNKDKQIAKSAKWYKENRDVAREKSRKKSNQRTKSLDDTYIRRLLTEKSNILTAKDIPQSLIRAKRAHLKGLRLIKEQEDARQEN